jgi:hypothetical protein
MKKVAIGFVLVLLGLGVATTSNFIIRAFDNPSEDEEENNVNGETLEPKEDPVDGKEEVPDKTKEKPIKATVEINPNKINCKSNGKWITAYIGLPSSYNVEQIDITSILLITEVGEIATSDEFPHGIVDIDDDNHPGLMVKFDRTALIQILEPMQFCEITLLGELLDNKKFEWGGVIEVLHYA